MAAHSTLERPGIEPGSPTVNNASSAEIAAFAEELVKRGKLLPQDKDHAVAMMRALRADRSRVPAETVIADAIANGQVSGPMVAVWREIGETDRDELVRLARMAPNAQRCREMLHTASDFFGCVHELRAVLHALRYAVIGDYNERDPDTESKINWLAVFDGLVRLCPDDEPADNVVHDAINTLRALNDGAARLARRAAGGSQETRAAMVAQASEAMRG